MSEDKELRTQVAYLFRDCQDELIKRAGFEIQRTKPIIWADKILALIHADRQRWLKECLPGKATQKGKQLSCPNLCGAVCCRNQVIDEIRKNAGIEEEKE